MLKTVEEQIAEAPFGGKLAEWREEEKKWQKQVLRLEDHKDLSNPYEPSVAKGE